jgi:hypothetical protein
VPGLRDPSLDGICWAPWTDDEVENLWLRQGVLHPYTCNGFDGIVHEAVNLVPKRDGWHCPRCTFTQAWAHTIDVKRRMWWEKR